MAGAELHGARNNKTDVLRYACAQWGIEDMRSCLMVGDRKYDVQGAHAVGMACAGVLYGYGSREELAEARADYLCATVPDLRRLLLGDSVGHFEKAELRQEPLRRFDRRAMLARRNLPLHHP